MLFGPIFNLWIPICYCCGVEICKWITHSTWTTTGSKIKRFNSLPDMKTTCCRCCWGVAEVYHWATLSAHLLTPPRERTLGIGLSRIKFATKTSTLAVEFIEKVSSKAFYAENPANYTITGWTNSKTVWQFVIKRQSHKFITTQGVFLTLISEQMLSAWLNQFCCS